MDEEFGISDLLDDELKREKSEVRNIDAVNEEKMKRAFSLVEVKPNP